MNAADRSISIQRTKARAKTSPGVPGRSRDVGEAVNAGREIAAHVALDTAGARRRADQPQLQAILP